MKLIPKNKANEPQDFIRHKKQQNTKATYENAPKVNLTVALLEEQNYICCYCMQRIEVSDTSIEHFLPKSIYDGTNGFPDLTLDYGNLMATCTFGDNVKGKLQHCDDKKGNDIININPLDKRMMDKIIFANDGQVIIDDKSLQNDIDVTLNLNLDSLKEKRAGIINSLQKLVNSLFKNKPVSKTWLLKQIDEWNTPKDLRLKSFCQVAIYWLTKQLKKAK